MRLLILLIGALLPLVAAEPITVLAAASLTEALGEVGKAFKALHPTHPVRIAFGASNQLRLQIQQGAPAQVFASADEAQMEALVKAGRVKTSRRLGSNRLALLARDPGPVKSWSDLAKGGVRLVVTQPPVPIGLYTEALLERLGREPEAPRGFSGGTRQNVVSRETHVRQLRAKVELGEADAAIVYASDALHPKRGVRIVPLPEHLQPEIHFTIAALEPDRAGGFTRPRGGGFRGGRSEPSEQAVLPGALSAGEAFVNFATGPQGRAILQKYGFR